MENATVSGLALTGDPVSARPVLGDTVPVTMFRALRLVGMMEGLDATIGDASTLVYNSGKKLGSEIGSSIYDKTGEDLNRFVDEVTKTVKGLGVGLLTVAALDLDNNFLSLQVDECITCSGMPSIGKKLCHFEGGIIAGIMEAFTKTECVVKETKCNGNGDGVCQFDVYIM